MLTALTLAALTSVAQAQDAPDAGTPAPPCAVGSAVSLGRSTWRHHALVVATSARGALAVTLAAPTRAEVVSLGAEGAPSPAESFAFVEGERLVDLTPVADAFLLRTIAVCPNTGRLFHKCLTLRVLGADGRVRGAPLVEDVVEWGGGGPLVVLGARVVMVRALMYASDRPLMAAYEVGASGVARVGEVRPLGSLARPAAEVVLASDGGRWAAVLVSGVSEGPPELVTDDGARLRVLRGLPRDVSLRALHFEAGGFLLVYEQGERRRLGFVHVADDARGTLSRTAPLRSGGLPAVLARQTTAVVAVRRGHLWLERRDAAGALVGRDLDLGEARPPRRGTLAPRAVETAHGWLVAWVGAAAPLAPAGAADRDAREGFVRALRCDATTP